MKPFLVLQLRGNDLAADGEYYAFLKYGGIDEQNAARIRMEKDALPTIKLDDYSGVIVGGGPWNVSDAPEKKTDKQKEAETWLETLLNEIVETDFPYFGACYGFGALVKARPTGYVSKERYAENVEALTVKLKETAQEDPLTKDLPLEFRTFAGHKESCQELPEDAVWLAYSDTCPYHMFRIKENVYAAQFHPELDAPGICERIDVYKNAGYFPPEDADKLKEAAYKEDITTPQEILRRFVEKYRSPER